MIIRRAEIEDAELLSKISTETFFDTFKDTCTNEDMQDFLKRCFNVQQTTEELKDESDFYFFAEENGEVIGYIRFKEDYEGFPLMKKWKAMELKRIYVVKEFQGKGAAQQLMNFTINCCIQNNYEVLWLGVWEHNLRAQKFYLKNGFVNSGHIHDFPIGNTPQTDFWFWKFL